MVADALLLDRGYDDTITLYQQALSLIQQGKAKAALRFFQEIISKEPQCAPAFFGMGICYQFMGQRDDALYALHQAARLDVHFATHLHPTLPDRLATLFRYRFLRLPRRPDDREWYADMDTPERGT